MDSSNKLAKIRCETYEKLQKEKTEYIEILKKKNQLIIRKIKELSSKYSI